MLRAVVLSSLLLLAGCAGESRCRSDYWWYKHVFHPLGSQVTSIESVRPLALDLDAQVWSFCRQKGDLYSG
jgi:hypothetical protein